MRITKAILTLLLVALPLTGALILPVWVIGWLCLGLMCLVLKRKSHSAQKNCCIALCVFVLMIFSVMWSHSVIAAQALLGAWILALVWGMKAALCLWIYRVTDKFVLKGYRREAI